MPRAPRTSIGGLIYHVLNRAEARMRFFENPCEYEAFESLLHEALQQVPMRILSYCLMPNHWHMVLWPQEDGHLSAFMQWLATTHSRRWHMAHDSVGSGHLYQGRFKSFPTQSDTHMLIICRYVERNPLRAGLVQSAQDWPWSSLSRRLRGSPAQKALLADGPVPWPANWLAIVNRPQSDRELQALRRCTMRGQPFGEPGWMRQMAQLRGRR